MLAREERRGSVSTACLSLLAACCLHPGRLLAVPSQPLPPCLHQPLSARCTIPYACPLQAPVCSAPPPPPRRRALAFALPRRQLRQVNHTTLHTQPASLAATTRHFVSHGWRCVSAVPVCAAETCLSSHKATDATAPRSPTTACSHALACGADGFGGAPGRRGHETGGKARKKRKTKPVGVGRGSLVRLQAPPPPPHTHTPPPPHTHTHTPPPPPPHPPPTGHHFEGSPGQWGSIPAGKRASVAAAPAPDALDRAVRQPVPPPPASAPSLMPLPPSPHVIPSFLYFQTDPARAQKSPMAKHVREPQTEGEAQQ